jgi:hypothetical protein
MFRSVTTGAADGIAKRAGDNQAPATMLHTRAEALGAHRLPELAERLERQARGERRLADWLRGLAGGDARDVTA